MNRFILIVLAASLIANIAFVRGCIDRNKEPYVNGSVLGLWKASGSSYDESVLISSDFFGQIRDGRIEFPSDLMMTDSHFTMFGIEDDDGQPIKWETTYKLSQDEMSLVFETPISDGPTSFVRPESYRKQLDW